MKLALMDPGLFGFAGHHLDLNLKTAKNLHSMGYKLTIYSHKNISVDVINTLSVYAKVIPLFTVGPYLKHNQIDIYAGDFFSYLKQCTSITHSLQSISEDETKAWLWTSINAPQLFSCAQVVKKIPIIGCTHLGVQNEYTPNGQIWWRHAIVESLKKNLNFSLGCIEKYQINDYQKLMPEIKFHLFPNFYDATGSVFQKNEIKKIGFFGHQRLEKGNQLIPKIVAYLINKYNFQIVIQDSSSISNESPHPNVKKIGYVKDLGKEISDCDLIVLPYDQMSYSNKGSGIMLEAFANGVPIIVPDRTTLSEQVNVTKSGVSFKSSNSENVLEAIEKARLEYSKISKAAFETAIQWKNHHGIKPFVKSLISSIG